MSSDKEFPQEKPKLVEIAVRGFRKHLNESRLELSRVNFLLGPNNAGKTSFSTAYELVSAIQRSGSIYGLREAEVMKTTGYRPDALNSNFPAKEALDFSVEAVVNSGPFTSRVRYTGSNHNTLAWELEVDGLTAFLWPGSKGVQWVLQPVGRSVEPWGEERNMQALRKKVVQEVMTAFSEFGFEFNAHAQKMLEGISGIGGSSYAHWSEMPDGLRGVVASHKDREGVNLVYSGEGHFWLVDGEGVRTDTDEVWEELLQVNSTGGLTKVLLGRLMWLVRSLYRFKGVNQLIFSGALGHGTYGQAKGMSFDLAQIGLSWQQHVARAEVIQEYGVDEDDEPSSRRTMFDLEQGWSFVDKMSRWEAMEGWDEDGMPKNFLEDSLWSLLVNLWDGALIHGWQDLNVPSSLSPISRFPPYLIMEVDAEGKLDMSRIFPGLADDEIIPMSEDWGKVIDHMSDLGLDVDMIEFGDVILHFTRTIPEDAEFPVTLVECKCGDHEARLLLDPKTKLPIWEGESRLIKRVQRESSEALYPNGKLVSLEDLTREREENEARISALNNFGDSTDAGGALSFLWSRSAKHMMMPFSFKVIRVLPDVSAMRSQYHRSEDFPFPELWEWLRSSADNREIRARLRDGQRVIQACLGYLGIGSGFKMRWKPVNKRVELSLSDTGSIDDRDVRDWYEKGPLKGQGEDEVEGHELLSEWFASPPGDSVAASEEGRPMKDGIAVEELGRGSRLVLHCLLAMFEASLLEDPVLVVLEEPSAFLHPKMAARFSQALRFAAEEFDVQVIVETHNEYMVRQLVTKRLEGDDLGDVTIHFLEAQPYAEVISLGIDDSGRFNPPIPDGFLDKSQAMMREQSKLNLGKELGL